MPPRKRQRGEAGRDKPDPDRYPGKVYADIPLFLPTNPLSWVWEYTRWAKAAAAAAKEYDAVCLLCAKTLWRQPFYGTKNVERHLESVHKKVSPKALSAAANPVVLCCRSRTCQVLISFLVQMKGALDKMFSGVYRNEAESALIRWLLADLRPINTVVSQAFKNLWSAGRCTRCGRCPPYATRRTHG